MFDPNSQKHSSIFAILVCKYISNDLLNRCNKNFNVNFVSDIIKILVQEEELHFLMIIMEILGNNFEY